MMGFLDRFRATPEQRAQAEQHRKQVAADRDRERRARDRVSRARDQGLVHRSEYISADEMRAQLVPNGAGLVDARLERRAEQLLLITRAGGMVNPKSPGAYKMGIYSFSIRGTGHWPGAKTGDFRPGAPLRLVREPDNEYDANAIAVYALTGRSRAGYVNKQCAGRLARLIDAGDDIVAIATRGAGPGRESVVPYVLACERSLMQHLLRGSGITLPD